MISEEHRATGGGDSRTVVAMATTHSGDGATDLQVGHGEREVTVAPLVPLLEDPVDDPGDDAHAGLVLLG